jgi:hypothetical protein
MMTRRYVRALLAHLSSRQGEPGAQPPGRGRADDARRRRHVGQGVAPGKRAAADGAPGLDGGAAGAVGQGAARDQQAGEDLALPAHHPRHRHGHQRRLPNAGHLRALRRRGA